MLYDNHMIAVAARHIYVYDKDSGTLTDTINLKSVS